ncbi:hypothetical protein HNQ91_002865 [Filimonas zeae]|uniref:Uncharacterized protein n=1 Tax=Filimonas zeae TaxID=1737353 RepID=A0A917IZQ3_9BACT|nr:hypothetical protein [Filimonas zeae]MDR6339800.1 hypothetical protein [Filimonas zeae]GGH69712.1 hypothetical protein GCM10011379_27280 [Filimonas zeae]
MQDIPYKYRLRPAYGSDKLLLEFSIDKPDGKFEKALFSALESIHPVIEDIADLWMNDEVLLTVATDRGSFLYSKDIWGFAFIMAEENQDCILKIDAILNTSSFFQKEEVDYGMYKTPRS